MSDKPRQKRERAHVFENAEALNALLDQGWLVEQVHRFGKDGASLLVILWQP